MTPLYLGCFDISALQAVGGTIRAPIPRHLDSIAYKLPWLQFSNRDEENEHLTGETGEDPPVIETIDDSLFFLRQMSQARCILRFLAIPEGLSPSKSSSLEDIVIVVVRGKTWVYCGFLLICRCRATRLSDVIKTSNSYLIADTRRRSVSLPFHGFNCTWWQTPWLWIAAMHFHG
jgi:hypothetical protein